MKCFHISLLQYYVLSTTVYTASYTHKDTCCNEYNFNSTKFPALGAGNSKEPRPYMQEAGRFRVRSHILRAFTKHRHIFNTCFKFNVIYVRIIYNAPDKS